MVEAATENPLAEFAVVGAVEKEGVPDLVEHREAVGDEESLLVIAAHQPQHFLCLAEEEASLLFRERPVGAQAGDDFTVFEGQRPLETSMRGNLFAGR